MIKVGQTTTNETITLPYELTNDGDTSISLQELKGNTTQNGTPTPTSPQQVNVVKGINILNPNWNDRTLNGVTITNNNDGTFTLNGTSTSNSAFALYSDTGENPKAITEEMKVNVGKYVTLSTGYTTGQGFYIQFNGTKQDNTQYGYIAGVQTFMSKIISDQEANLKGGNIFIGINANTSYNNLVVKPMITITDTQITSNPDYIPYNTIQVKVVGKNLFDINETELGDINTSTGEDVSSTTIRRTRYIQVQSNTTYTISFNNTTNNKRIFLYNSNKQLINTTLLAPAESVKTITTTNETQYIRFKIVSTQFNEETQLEKGTTATTYEEYKSTTYPITLGDIELCKIGTYQDRIYKNNGKWYLYKAIGKITFNGTETGWASETMGTNQYRYTIPVTNAPTTTARQQIFSNYFFSTHDGRQVTGGGFAGIGKVFLYNYDVTSVADFKTWLTTHNTIVYFRYETPTTTEITDETLLEQLEAIGELYRGTNNIMITDTIAPVENIIIEKSNAEFDLVPYIKREPKIDYIDRKGDTGYTADGHYFENIIARKRGLEFELIPMSQEDYADVISRFMNITSIPVFISDTYTNQNLKLNMFKKAIISNTQLTEYGRIRGTKISLEEI